MLSRAKHSSSQLGETMAQQQNDCELGGSPESIKSISAKEVEIEDSEKKARL